MLVRHGRPDGTWGRDPDPGLDALGHEQAEAVADALAPLGPLPVVVSPLRRTRETATPLLAAGRSNPWSSPRSASSTAPADPRPDHATWLRTLMAGTGAEHPAVMDTVPRPRPRGDSCASCRHRRRHALPRDQRGGRRGHRRRPHRVLCARTLLAHRRRSRRRRWAAPGGARRRRAARRTRLTRCSRVRHLAGARCYVPAAPTTDPGGRRDAWRRARHLLQERVRVSVALVARRRRHHVDRAALLLQLRAGARVRRDGGRGPQQRDRQAREPRAVVVPLGGARDRRHRAADPGLPGAARTTWTTSSRRRAWRSPSASCSR